MRTLCRVRNKDDKRISTRTQHLVSTNSECRQNVLHKNQVQQYRHHKFTKTPGSPICPYRYLQSQITVPGVPKLSSTWSTITYSNPNLRARCFCQNVPVNRLCNYTNSECIQIAFATNSGTNSKYPLSALITNVSKRKIFQH